MVLPLKVSINRSVGAGVCVCVCVCVCVWTWTQAFTEQRIGVRRGAYTGVLISP